MNDALIILVVSLPLLALWALSIVEVVRRRDLATGRTMAWVAALLIAPLFALVVYIVVRPARAVETSRTDADSSLAATVVDLAERRQRGELSASGYVDGVRELMTQLPSAPATNDR